MEISQKSSSSSQASTVVSGHPHLDIGEHDLFMSLEGTLAWAKSFDPADPAKNTLWTTDPRVELPILYAREDKAMTRCYPITVMDWWKSLLPRIGSKKSLSTKSADGTWQSITYQEYYDLVIKFALGLVRLGISERSAVSILGYNHSNWVISAFGTIFANCINCGHYITNTPAAVQQIIEHSDSEVICVDSQGQLDKVLEVWGNLPQLKYVIVWKDYKIDPKYSQHAPRVILHEDFINGEVTDEHRKELERRMGVQRPGHAISYVYTSGTTGNPKGVMLSHDNYVWTVVATEDDVGRQMKLPGYEGRMISYMPMNHVAAQLTEMYLSLFLGTQVFFTDISALRGTIGNYVQEVKPTVFFSVPRIWEKFEEKLRAVELEKGELDSAEAKKILGLENCLKCIAGAAPMSEKTRIYFNDKDMYISNNFGMSEATGLLTGNVYTEPMFRDLKGIGKPYLGYDFFVLNADDTGKGELTFRSRGVFMGYLKNEEATRESKDQHGILHTGDEGCIDPETQVVSITGRLKEIIMTSGGENVAPVPIEDNIKQELCFISNAVLIGDNQKFIQVMLTFKVNVTPIGKPTQDLAPEALAEFEKLGIKGVATVGQAAENPLVKKAIQSGIDKTNQVAVSSAATVKDWFVVEEDFWVGGGELTPTLKLKRKEIVKKHHDAIQKAYAKGSD